MKDIIVIDASKKKIGRIASQIALVLRGKNKADFLPNKAATDRVVVTNVDRLDVDEKRLKDIEFTHYTGYPGGLRKISALKAANKDMREVLRRAIRGMLPKNKLRDLLMKNLTLYHGDEK